ncbi:MAG: Na/Pi symporter, partial [Calditrichota bacterium]
FTFHSPIKTITAPTVNWLHSLCLAQPLMNGEWLALILALLLLFFSLRNLTKLIRSLVISRLEAFFDTHIFKTWARAMGFGVFLTVLVQSSSITTSLVVPLAGAGILALEQIFPYTLGANIGTTITAILASLVSGTHAPLAVAFSHLLFNIFGILLIWFIPPMRRIPLWLSRGLAKQAVKNRIIPFVYIISVFFILPLTLIIIVR